MTQDHQGHGSGLPTSPLFAPGAIRAVEALFDHLPDIYYFVKDAEGRFLDCNEPFMALLGARRKEEVLGKRDCDFFPRDLSDVYMEDDREVLRTGRPIIDKLELVRNPSGSIDWHNTTKLPLRGPDGTVQGLAGVTRDLKKMRVNNDRFVAMAPVIETILTGYGGTISVAELARKASLSVSQFERRFKERFRTTPVKYIARVRIDAACELLARTELPLAEIAKKVGFYDQSHFTHQFVRHKQMTPLAYRRKYAAVDETDLPS
jgi:PAS domain S-box-containing protein